MKLEVIKHKVAIVDNGTALFQLIDKTLRHTEGYEVISISNDKTALTTVINDPSIDIILHDMKSETGFPILLNKKQETFSVCKLSPREKEVMTLLAKGLKYKEISQSLAITLGTLKQYIHTIYEKLHASNKTQAINIYFNR